MINVGERSEFGGVFKMMQNEEVPTAHTHTRTCIQVWAHQFVDNYIAH